MILPIFQFCLDRFENNKYGLVFPQESNIISTLTFAYPITFEDFRERKRLTSLFFPSLVYGEYAEFGIERTKYRNRVNVNVSKSINISFELVNYTNLIYGKKIKTKGFQLLSYTGDFPEYVEMIEGFILFKPVNEDEMIRLYEKNGIVLIGFTPKFGRRDWMFQKNQISTL